MDLFKVLNSCSDLTRRLLFHGLKEGHGVSRDLLFKVRVIDLVQLHPSNWEKQLKEQLKETTFMVEDDSSFSKYWAFLDIGFEVSATDTHETVSVEGKFNPSALEYIRGRWKIDLN